MAIWVCADLHLQDKQINEFCAQKFNSVEEHDKYVIDRYNSVVGKDDLVYILGDVGFRPTNVLATLVRQLNGRKILIVGNHDQLNDTEYKNMGFIEVIRHPVYYNNNIILSHIPCLEAYDNPYVINVHGHLHNNALDLDNFFNVNVEMNDFLPINIKVFEEIANKMCLKTRWERFGSEWYYAFYKNISEVK